jgi:hypothetical protein
MNHENYRQKPAMELAQNIKEISSQLGGINITFITNPVLDTRFRCGNPEGPLVWSHHHFQNGCTLFTYQYSPVWDSQISHKDFTVTTSRYHVTERVCCLKHCKIHTAAHN